MELITGIIILNYNNYELTIKCAENLLKLELKARILIVDNKSPNQSFQALKDHFNNIIEVIQTSQNKGYSYGNNYGFRYLRNKYPEIKYICIMNPDVIITDASIFDNLTGFLKNYDDIAAITGMTLTRGKLNITNCFWNIPRGFEVATEQFELSERKQLPLKPDNNGVAKVEVIPGCFFIIKADIFEKIGGFDENTFLFNEENILAIKIKELGMTNALSVNDSYIHNHIHVKKNLKQKLKSKEIGYNSRRYLASTYYGTKERIFLEIIIIINRFIISLKYLKKHLSNL